MKSENKVRISFNLSSSQYSGEEFQNIIIHQVNCLVDSLKDLLIDTITDAQRIEYTKPTPESIESLLNKLKNKSYTVSFKNNTTKRAVSMDELRDIIKKHFNPKVNK